MKLGRFTRWTWALVGLSLAAVGNRALALPDLVINKRLLKTSIVVERERFSTRGCEYREGCIRAAGSRKLLRVDVGFANVGPHDLVVGRPENRPGIFEFSGCHNHYHLKGFMKYRLLTRNFTPVLAAKKQAFCVRDNYPYTSWAGGSRGYNCESQGLTAGWQDVYDKSLDCQFVDITGVPPGNYLLEVTVNPVRRFAERNYDNNRAVAIVTVPRL